MATFKRFEDIECWKKARELTRRVYEITNKPAFARDFALKDQIRRAAVSVMSNIAEGLRSKWHSRVYAFPLNCQRICCRSSMSALCGS
jgi:four helix bundle protein